MINHYLKIAWRNLLKYKSQSIISILGLAIGFVAFSFTISWIRYETGYDKHIQDADRVYQVFKIDNKAASGVQSILPIPLKQYLENIPGVEAITATDIRNNRHFQNATTISADSSFFQVFYPELSVDIPSEGVSSNSGLFILSEKEARIRNITKDDLINSVFLDDDSRYPVIDIIKDMPKKQTNIPFDIIQIKDDIEDSECPWCYLSKNIYLRIGEQVDVNTILTKIDSVYIEDSWQGVMSYTLVPLRKVNYTYPQEIVKLKFNHILIFALVSILVMLSAFFNYLMLFTNKVKLRNRELALRKVNGASSGNQIVLLLTEIGITTFSALLIGGILTELLYPFFIKLSEIEATKAFVLKEMLLYGIAVLSFSLLSSIILLFYNTQKSIVQNIQSVFYRRREFKNSFTKASLFIQLVVSTLFILCTFIFVYQYRQLNSKEIGFDRFNINTFKTYESSFTKEEIANIIGVKEVIFFNDTFLPRTVRSSFTSQNDAGEWINVESFRIAQPDFINFFDIKVLEGRNFHEGEMNVCLINETLKKKLGLANPIGASVNNLTIIGVVADMYIDAPSLPILPTSYQLHEKINYTITNDPNISEDAENGISHLPLIANSFAYKYYPGYRKSTEQEIIKLAAEKDNQGKVFFQNMEETYADYTQSEKFLLVLLSIMTGVATLIALFGIYSMVTLSCNQRRKEIAIRKVNGAKTKEIFGLFFKEYFYITLFSAIVAFPIGSFVMHRWLEQYARRVTLKWWLFAAVFMLICFIVFSSIFMRVFRAAKENPAHVIKSDQ